METASIETLQFRLPGYIESSIDSIEIEKFNECHDAQGRFCEGAGSVAHARHIIEEAGGKFERTTQGKLKPGEKMQVAITERESGSSGVMDLDEVTPESVRRLLNDIRERFGLARKAAIDPDDSGRWVTIRGVHVYIDDDGTITRGPASLLGKKPEELGDDDGKRPDTDPDKEVGERIASGSDDRMERRYQVIEEAKKTATTKAGRYFVEHAADDWQVDARGGIARSMEAAVAEEFGGEVYLTELKRTASVDETWDQVARQTGALDKDDARQDARQAMRRYVRVQYATTQALMRRSGEKEEIKLYRGTRNQVGTPREMVEVEVDALQSFSTSYDTAFEFAGSGGSVIELRVPRSAVFSFPQAGLGHVEEDEILVLGGGKKWTGRRLR